MDTTDKVSRATRLRILKERAEARHRRLIDVYRYADEMARIYKRAAIHAESLQSPDARGKRQTAVEWSLTAHDRFIKQREYNRDIRLARAR